MRRYLFIIISSIFIFILPTERTVADDLDPHYKFSGVKAPESPYKNTWGAFQTNLFSGSFGYDYKIAVPPGTNGLAPHLVISYNSHGAKGKAGWVGAGWDMPLSYIQRDIEYTRKATTDDTFDLYLDGAKHDLVYVTGESRYHTKVEAYLRIEKKSGAPNEKGEYWLVSTKDGTEYRFGYTLDAENLVRATDTSFPKYVWRWSLDRIKDSNGNCIYFTYKEDQGAVYLSRIEYNNDKKRVVDFVLENKPDAYLTIDQGSEVLDALRLREVKISVNGALAGKYRLNYVLNGAGNRSLLASITRYGSDGVSALPPVQFAYQPLTRGFAGEVNWNTPGSRDIRTTDDDSDNVADTFDLNGDGLPDLVKNNRDYWDVWLNTGSSFPEESIRWPIPSGWEIRDVESTPNTPNTRSNPMDIDRDGYVDFLWADGKATLALARNLNGKGFSGVGSMALPTTAWIREVQKPDNVAANVKQDFFDMNGDGLPDLVKREGETAWHVWRNTGSGFADFGIWQVPHGRAWLEDFTRPPTNTQVGRFDVNGDGLPDIVNPKGANSSGISEWQIYLNTGSDFLQVASWPAATNSDLISVADTTGNVKREFMDINGDGLPDIVDPDEGSADWAVYFNTGKGFSARTSWPGIFTDGFVRDQTKPDAEKNTHTARDVFDIDGDGLPDIVRKRDTDWKVYKNLAGRADLLTRVTDTLGGTITVEYVPSIGFPNTRLPFNYWVVGSTTTNNGMNGPHGLVSVTRYAYAGGLHDFPTREFRGFATVTETRADGSKVVHHYHQDEARKGKEYNTTTTDSANLPYASVVNTFNQSATNNVFTSNLTRTDQNTFDASPDNPKTIRQEFQRYDDYGNAGLQINHGDLAVSGDEVYTYNEYWPPCATGSWVTDRPRHSYQTATADSAKLRESFFWYDDGASCPDKGNLTKEEHWLDTGTNPVTLYRYDSYGNRDQTIDPEKRLTRIEYDPEYHAFPAKTFNPKDQLTRRTFNPATGEVATETDPNGYTTSFAFDTFQRKTKEIKPYDSVDLPTSRIQYFIDGTAPEFVVVAKRENPGAAGTLDTVQTIDGFGNLVQTKTEYENPAKMIATDVYYDTMGRVAKQVNPYLTDNAYGYSTPNPAVPAISYGYDTLGRPTLITNPDRTTVSRVFDHWSVTETDENKHAKDYSFDAAQRLKQVVEHNKGESYTTRYSYSPLGELIRIVDHPGNITTIAYDSLGRKSSMDDPDMGFWEYRYDGVGNLVSQTDARGVTTIIHYDPLNRKELVDYPNSADITYVYDSETIGTLAKVVDAAGPVTYTHDQRLRKIREDRSIDEMTWATKWNYDSMDRVTGMVYPDGEEVTFTYNNQGQLESIPGVVTGMDYNASGQVTRKEYANGISTTYDYDQANQRLAVMAATGIQNLRYTYDSVGNITSIIDGLTRRTEQFGYDDLDRLTSAGDETYSRTYGYNAIGNMLTETKDGHTTTFSYGKDAGPHAVTGMSGEFPVVGALALANGVAVTHSNRVTLNSVAYGNPSQYMASEDRNFTGASWKPYAVDPVFLLSAGFGIKTVYFKIRNSDGESEVKSDSIAFQLNPADGSLDDDGDGLSNRQEYEHGTDATLKDTDGDGWTDSEEINQYGSNPLAVDTDGDGLRDSGDPYPLTPYHNGFSENYSVAGGMFNAGGGLRSDGTLRLVDRLGNVASRKTFEDTDEDGIPDKDDSDDDNDGMPDSWEIQHGLNPLNPADAAADLDGDRLANIDEYLAGTNPAAKDTDRDGLDDFQEVTVALSDPLIPDTDGDGLPDGRDPAPNGIYHSSVSETYAVLGGNFNSGGGLRAGNLYADRDALGQGIAGNGVVVVQNNPPGISGEPAVTVAEDALYSFMPTASDIDQGDTLRFSVVNKPGWAVFDPVTGTLSGTPANADVGTTAGIVISVTDSKNASTSLPAFDLTVINTNDPPQFTSTAPVSGRENSAYSCTVTAAEVDIGDTLAFSGTFPDWLTLVDHGDGTATLSGTPGNDAVGENTVTLRVTDGMVEVEQSFVITIANVNNAPIFTSTALTSASQGADYRYAVTIEDIDAGASLSITAPVKPAWLTLTDNGGGRATLGGTPTNAEVGDHAVTLRVTDGTVAAKQTFTITVTNTNDEPRFTSSAVTSATEDSPYSYHVVAGDEDPGDALTFSAPIKPAWLTLLDNGDGTASLTGSPTNSDVGEHTVVLRVSDGTTHSDQVFTLTVDNVNDPPFFTSAPVTAATAGQPYVCTMTAGDMDPGDSLHFSAVTLPSWLSLTDNGKGGAILSGQPGADQLGDHPVQLTVTDKAGESDTRQFTIIVGRFVANADINNDGVVDLKDAVVGLQFLSGGMIGGGAPTNADVNGDGRLGIEEIIYVMRGQAEMSRQ